ncbi:MAG: hypothetical protein J6V09_03765 [Clostridia bacterium]|nr:hypothetical protein [Clostridia bacterium]
MLKIKSATPSRCVILFNFVGFNVLAAILGVLLVLRVVYGITKKRAEPCGV